MRYNTLGRTDLKISELCLGSMTWGSQNTADEAHAQIDMALDHGLNFIDTAEMYPVNPIRAETVGNSEKIIGEWLAKSGRRNEVILATKVTGANGGFVRDGRGYDGAEIIKAVDQSLKRLQTDVIDIYQLHWPNRGSYMFRQNWTYDPSGQNRAETVEHMQDVLGALAKCVAAGKIRHCGLSNESAWGTAMWLRLADEMGAPRMVSIQNEYSLLCRMFDTDLSETCVNEDVGLLAFSPLAAGLLTGKYSEHITPEGSRRSLNETLGGRTTPRVWPTIEAYMAVADKHGLNVVQMALAWCRTRPFMASAIFGATKPEHLKLALGATDVDLSQEVIDDINATHRANPMPY